MLVGKKRVHLKKGIQCCEWNERSVCIQIHLISMFARFLKIEVSYAIFVQYIMMVHIFIPLSRHTFSASHILVTSEDKFELSVSKKSYEKKTQVKLNSHLLYIHIRLCQGYPKLFPRISSSLIPYGSHILCMQMFIKF